MLMQVILVKFILYVIEKCKKIHRFISWQNPVKVRKMSSAPTPPPKKKKKKKKTISILYLLQAQLALALTLLDDVIAVL